MKRFTIILILVIINYFFIFNKSKKMDDDNGRFTEINIVNPIIEKPKLSITNLGYLSYDAIVNQIKLWESEASNYIEVGTYGKSTRGKDLSYIRLTNESINENKGRILITACIHGNEPWAAAITMNYIPRLLLNNTDILDDNEVYFIPVVSPDSYPNSRHVDGVDPNRDFPNEKNRESIQVIRHLMNFFLEKKFNAVISGHTWGRVYLIPPGNSMQNVPDNSKYVSIVSKMAEMSRYRYMKISDLYTRNGLNIEPPSLDFNLQTSNHYFLPVELYPIYGTEVDWYYKHGAFAIVAEYGTHQRIPTESEVRSEFERTYSAFIYFLEHAVGEKQ